jgi:hypothetical protein
MYARIDPRCFALDPKGFRFCAICVAAESFHPLQGSRPPKVSAHRSTGFIFGRNSKSDGSNLQEKINERLRQMPYSNPE